MIRTVADFLDEIKTKGIETILSTTADIKHRPTIGNIYEGLTSSLLNKSIFEGLNLKVVLNSFIVNKIGIISKEMDCLIVVGEGEKISFTNQYKYHISNVIAIIQVKKKLYKKDVEDSFINLNSVRGLIENTYAEPYVLELQQDAYKLLVGKYPPHFNEVNTKPIRAQIIFHLLMLEAYFPIRIVFGYFGYKDEWSFREAVFELLEVKTQNGPYRGYGPVGFPNLILCGNQSIMKNNGMPMGIPFQNDFKFYWPLLTSSSRNGMYYLLQLIWTRLCYKFNLDSAVFGKDFEAESSHPFLSCFERQISEDSWGWEFYYHCLSKQDLERPLKDIPYEPVELSDLQYRVLRALSTRGKINLIDKELKELTDKPDLDVDLFFKDIIRNRLVFIENGYLYPLVDKFEFVFTPEGKIVVGENRSGELTDWVKKQSKRT